MFSEQGDKRSGADIGPVSVVGDRYKNSAALEKKGALTRFKSKANDKQIRIELTQPGKKFMRITRRSIKKPSTFCVVS